MLWKPKTNLMKRNGILGSMENIYLSFLFSETVLFFLIRIIFFLLQLALRNNTKETRLTVVVLYKKITEGNKLSGFDENSG